MNLLRARLIQKTDPDAILAGLCSVLLLASALPCRAAVNSLQITVTNDVRIGTLTNFPVQVVLSTNISGFDYSSFLDPNGCDLRFWSDSLRTEALPHEIEKWNTNSIPSYANWSPTNVTNCRLWLRADLGLTLSGNSVSAWADQSGNGNNALQGTGSAQPLLVEGAINSRPTLRFDGGDSLATADLSAQFANGATLFVVATVADDNYTIYHTGSGDNYWRYSGNGYSYPCVFRTTRIETYALAPHGGTHTFRVATTNSYWEMWVDRQSGGINTVNSYSAGGVHTIGNGGGGGYFVGDIAEIVLFNRKLTSDEMAEVEAYFQGRYFPPGKSVAWVGLPLLTNNTTIFASWGDPAKTNREGYTTNGVIWASNNFVGVWHMADTSGADSTSNRYNGTAVGTISTYTGMIDGAVELDADTDYHTVADNAAFNMNAGFSVSAWISSDYLVDYESILSTYNGNGWIFALQDGNSLSFWDGSWRATRTVPDGAWTHVAFTHDGTTGKFFVDGTNCWTSTYSPGARDGGTLGLGGSPNWGSYVFDGRLDELRLENTCRATNWIWTTWINAASNDWFLNYGAVESVTPDINTTNGSVVGTISAWLQATMVSTGAAETEVWAFWGSSNAGFDATAWQFTNYFGTNTDVAPKAYSNNATGLTAGGHYYYTYRATNAMGASWGTVRDIWLLGPPGISNAAASAVNSNSATLNGSLWAGGNGQVKIYWGTTDGGPSPAFWDNVVSMGTLVAGTFSSNITFSTSGPFYYRCYVTNSYGEDWADTAERFVPDAAGVIYVDQAATGANNGTTWPDAYTNLVVALNVAVSNDVIWVARGTYKPYASSVTNSFYLRNCVPLYGGFKGGEGSIAQRNWTNNVTILSGDINNDGLLGAGNSYHVVQGNNNATLDGFTVTMGYANYTDGGGGGMFIGDCYQLVQNCTFVTNAGIRFGGAIYMYRGYWIPSVIVSNCTFRGNYVWSSSGGGAICVLVGMCSSLRVYDSTFIENRCDGAYWGGGAICLPDGFADIRRCVFTRNYCSGSGGAVYSVMREAEPTSAAGILEDSVFFENTASGDGGGALFACAGRSSDRISGCDFYANRTSGRYGGGGLALSGYTNTIRNCRFVGNTGTTGTDGGGGGLYVSGSASLDRIIIAGNSDNINGGGIYFFSGPKVMKNCLVVGNRTRYNGGGIYAATALTNLHCTVYGNETYDSGASYGGGGIYLAAGAARITNTIVWGNWSPNTNRQVHLASGSSTVNFDHSDLHRGTNICYNPNSATVTENANITNNPAFTVSSGVWTENAIYTNATGKSTLFNSNGLWAAGSLVGRFVNPASDNQRLQYYVTANTTNTITVMGDASAGVIGIGYQIYDYGLMVTSPCLEAAVEWGVTNDVAGNDRPLPAGGAPDIGAYEYPYDFLPPMDITNLVATAGYQQIQFDWTNPTNTDFAGVLVLRRVGAAPTSTPSDTNSYSAGTTIGDGVVAYVGIGTNGTAGGNSRWIDTALTNGTTYYYKFFAYDSIPNYADGVVTNSAPVNDTTAPANVTGLSATGGDNKMRLSWINPADTDYQGVLIIRIPGAVSPSGTPTAGFTYETNWPFGSATVAHVGVGTNGAPGGASSWTDAGLSNAATYSYKVFAYDERPNYASGSAVSGTTITDNTKPGAVSGLTASPGEQSVTLGWNNPSDTDFGGVLIVRRVGSASTWTPTDTNTYAAGTVVGNGVVVYAGTGSDGDAGDYSTWTDTGQTNGTAYYYLVFARDDVPNYAAAAGANATPTAGSGIIYVDDTAAGANDGSSWLNAYTSLSTALERSSYLTSTIWVAEGTYKPVAGNRTNAFCMRDWVKMYGGFTNGSPSLADRDWTNNPSVLSGDIDNNGILDTGNSYHVLLGADNAVLDGFTVTMGYIETGDTGGGAISLGDVFPAIQNCLFVTNAAYRFGGAIHQYLSGGSAYATVISNCEFRLNTVWWQSGGGAICVRTGTACGRVKIINSRFYDNTATNLQWGGGAICLYDVYPDIQGCTFARNWAQGNGGALYTSYRDVAPYGVYLNLVDNTFYANTATGAGGGAYLSGAGRAGDLISGCSFFANTATTTGGGGLYAAGFWGTMTGCKFSGNLLTAGDGGGMYLSGDCYIEDTWIVGHLATSRGGGLYATTDSRPRFQNVLVAGNRARYDGGGICMYDLAAAGQRSSWMIHTTVAANRTYENNSSYGGGGIYLGLSGSESSSCEFRNSIVSDNTTAGSGPQIRASGSTLNLDFAFTDLQGGTTAVSLASSATVSGEQGNLDTNAVFVGGGTGTWSAAASYSSVDGYTILTNSSATWFKGELAGKFLQSDTNLFLMYYILTNSEKSVTVWGVATNGDNGDPYRIYDFHPALTSPCIDSATNWGVWADIDGIPRPQPIAGGFDMGAYEYPVGTITVYDKDVVEGNGGTTVADFRIIIPYALDWNVSVLFVSSNGTASAGTDYVATNGTLVIAAGQLTGSIAVVVNGDTDIESAYETFYLLLSYPTNGVFGDSIALGRIVEDDTEPPAFDTDSDGMPDAWETNYSLDPNDATDAAEDADGDGLINYHEYIAGTEPNDATSYLILSLDQLNANDVQFSFTLGADRELTIKSADTTPAAALAAAGSVAVADTADGLNQWTDAGATAAAMRFYHVKVAYTDADRTKTFTNAIAQAMFTQTRAANGWYLIGPPVDFGAYSNLNSRFGQQLASGLIAGDSPATADCIYYIPPAGTMDEGTWYLYYLSTSGNIWRDADGGDPANLAVTATKGLWLKSSSSGGHSKTVFTGPVYTTSPAVNLQDASGALGGWTIFSWPLPTVKTHSDLGAGATPIDTLGFSQAGGHGGLMTSSGASTGDELRSWEGTYWRHFWLIGGVNGTYNGRWWDENLHDFANFSLEPGKAYYYRNRDGSFSWTPSP